MRKTRFYLPQKPVYRCVRCCLSFFLQLIFFLHCSLKRSNTTEELANKCNREDISLFPPRQTQSSISGLTQQEKLRIWFHELAAALNNEKLTFRP